MKKLVTFASNVHAGALLSCSAAVLLAACGGSTSDTPTATASHGVQSAIVSEATVAAAGQTAALTEQSAGTGAFEHASVTATTAPATPRLLATISSAITGTEAQIIELYRSLLGREPDAAGLQYWTQQVNAGFSLQGVSNAIMSSAEYQNRQQTVPSAADPSIYHLYVATSGSDANPGTQARPFKTISKAAGAAKAGTTVHVAAGTYSGNVTTNTSGNSSYKIRFVSDTKWGAKIVGTGSEAMWTNGGSYVEINGFDITGPGRLGVLNNGSNTLISNNHVHNLTVSAGCDGNGGAGIVNANYAASNGDVIGNVVHDIGRPGACNGVQGIYSSIKGGKIMNNVVYRVSAFGIHLWHAATDITIANNTVFANGSSGMGGGSVIMKVGSATGTIGGDPKFVSYNPTGTGDYRLQSTSPAVNKGSASGAPATDILGVARPKGGAFDIGAYENF
jgi:hypothetical protein